MESRLIFMGCGRQFCPNCGEELIHRDHRRQFESASTLGQIVLRLGPRSMGAADVDLCTEKCISKDNHLLRILEHKQDRARPFRFSQEHILDLLAAIIDHAANCTLYTERQSSLQLDPRSGVFLVHGSVIGSTGSRRECIFAGPQTVTRRIDGQKRIFAADADIRPFMSWIYGSSDWRPRNG